MAQATSDDSEPEQCRAVVADGERCSRPADDDGFCYQHGPEDETVDDANDGDGRASADEESGDGEDAGSSGGDSSGSGGSDESSSSDSDRSSGDAADGSEAFDISDVRATAEELTESLIGHPFDGVIEVERVDGGWRTVVEVVERRSVPDTQDILGRYEVELDEDGAATGYRLTDRYRRGDTSGEPVA